MIFPKLRQIRISLAALICIIAALSAMALSVGDGPHHAMQPTLSTTAWPDSLADGREVPELDNLASRSQQVIVGAGLSPLEYGPANGCPPVPCRVLAHCAQGCSQCSPGAVVYRPQKICM